MLVLEPSLGSTGKLDNVSSSNPAFILASRSLVLSWGEVHSEEQQIGSTDYLTLLKPLSSTETTEQQAEQEAGL